MRAIATFVLGLLITSGACSVNAPMDGRKLGVILNQDDSARLYLSPGSAITAQWHRDHLLMQLIVSKPGVYSQCVGFPDPVIYRSKVATTMDKYIGQYTKDVRGDAMRRLLELGTDPLELVVEVCRQRGVLIVANFRMNAEDFGKNQLKLSDFGRAHKDWAIPGANCLDPAIPEVYEHRMAIFREVAENYDIDGLEFDFRRWANMVSEPLKNHGVLTRMVRDTRRMLDEVARKKRRKQRLLLGARVGISIDGPGFRHVDKSCRDLGLDVKTWVAEELVDYLIPSTFGGSFDRSRWDGNEKKFMDVAGFVDLVKGKPIGIYPTMWHYGPKVKKGSDDPVNKWNEFFVSSDDPKAMRRYKNGLCDTALDHYAKGAHGVSTFNWNQPDSQVFRFGVGAQMIGTYVYPLLGNPEALRAYRDADHVLPDWFRLPWDEHKRWKQ